MDILEEIEKCKSRTSRSDRRDLVSTWTEKELHEGKIKDVFSVIFRTRGCSWNRSSGCTMCGYYTDTNPSIIDEDLEEQVHDVSEKYSGEDIVKIYTSGSFLDEEELPQDIALKILNSFDTDKTVVETRPQYITEDRLHKYSAEVKKLEIAVGLESSNNFVLKNCINKGFRYEQYLEKRDTVFENRSKLRTYLLLKPPFLTEKEAIKDLKNSIQQVSHPDNIISVNPVNVQRGTLLEKLWNEKVYRPPWLWSLLKVFSEVSYVDSMLISSSVGLGSERGAHNCGECDTELVELIREFNLTQDIEPIKDRLKDPRCSCYHQWKKELELEPYLNFRGRVGILSDRYAGYV
ncbi:MAG: archaeosine biosynthesis radical SAM protein RaSEA [Candidatus Saliniplasma sp.]